MIRALELIRARDLWRLSSQSKNEPWVGEPIAKTLSVDLTVAENKKAINKLVGDWLQVGYLERVEAKDEKHEKRVYVRAGVDPVLEEAREHKGPGYD